jgi:hypothetical protein
MALVVLLLGMLAGLPGCDQTETYKEAEVDGDTLRVKETQVTREADGDLKVTEKVTEKKIEPTDATRVQTRTKTVEREREVDRD